MNFVCKKLMHEKFFRDATHLTREGGEKYGKLILKMCIEEL